MDDFLIFSDAAKNSEDSPSSNTSKPGLGQSGCAEKAVAPPSLKPVDEAASSRSKPRPQLTSRDLELALTICSAKKSEK